jgi:hypothetical protein
MSVTLILQAIIAVVPLVTDLIKYIAVAKKNNWIKKGDDIRNKIQITTENDKRMDLAEYLSKHAPK